MKSLRVALFPVMALLFCLAVPARADLVTPVAALADLNRSGPGDPYPASGSVGWTIDSWGFPGGDVNLGENPADLNGGTLAYWYVKPSSQGGGAYPPKSLYYDLGAPGVLVDRVHLWWSDRDPANITGRATDLDVDYLPLSAAQPAAFDLAAMQGLTGWAGAVDGNNPSAGSFGVQQDLDPEAFIARYVRLTINASGYGASSNQWGGLRQVALSGDFTKNWRQTAGDGQWGIAGNWDPTGVPGDTDDLVFTSSNYQDIRYRDVWANTLNFTGPGDFSFTYDPASAGSGGGTMYVTSGVTVHDGSHTFNSGFRPNSSTFSVVNNGTGLLDFAGDSSFMANSGVVATATFDGSGPVQIQQLMRRNTSANLHLVKRGEGTLTIAGGTTTSATGSGAGYSTGTLTAHHGLIDILSGGRMVTAATVVGDSGTDDATLRSSGYFRTTATMYVADSGAAQGTLLLNGGTFSLGSGLHMANYGTAQGTIIQTGGDVNISGEFQTATHDGGTHARYEIYGGTLTVGQFLQIGRQGTAEFLQDGDSTVVNVNRSHQDPALILGGRGRGTYTLRAGRLNVPNGHVAIGAADGSHGEFIQDDGTVDIGNHMSLAREHANTFGRYEIHGGTLDVDTYLQIGRLGTGEFLQTGGEVYVRRQDSDPALMVGAQGSATGLYTMENGELHVTRGRTVIGHVDQSGGTFLQHDGTVSLGHHLTIGNGSNTEGLWEIHDGELNLSTNKDHFFYVGNAGEGRFVQTGGNVTQPARGAMYLANSGSGEGYYDISGGTLDQGSLSIGSGGGFGEFTQTGGDVVARRDIRIARAGGTGAYAISGGTLTVDNSSGDNDGALNVGFDTAGSTGAFTQTGGIVDALGGVWLGRASGTSGVYTLSDGELRVPSISKGSGSAQFDWSGGTIRPRTGGNLSVTTPLTLSGTGATFNSSDAGGTARTITVSTGIGGSGSLTKAGDGELILSAANTYSGQTTVEAGTVHVTGSLANNGSPHIRVASAGDAFGSGDPTIVRRIAGGGSFAGLGSQIVGTGTLGTTADLLAGMNGNGSPLDLVMAWRTASTADTATFPPLTNLLSDVLQLDGMDGGNGQTDPFVLEMSYDASLVESYHDPLFLAWLDEGEWVKAVNGNFGWGGSAEAEFAGSWDAFVTAHGLDPASDLPDYLGSWGVDSTASTAWAVLNHNSQFAVLAIPEPGTWLLLLCAFAYGLLLRRRAK